jgi:hypothetical protein
MAQACPDTVCVSPSFSSYLNRCQPSPSSSASSPSTASPPSSAASTASSARSATTARGWCVCLVLPTSYTTLHSARLRAWRGHCARDGERLAVHANRATGHGDAGAPAYTAVMRLLARSSPLLVVCSRHALYLRSSLKDSPSLSSHPPAVCLQRSLPPSFPLSSTHRPIPLANLYFSRDPNRRSARAIRVRGGGALSGENWSSKMCPG